VRSARLKDAMSAPLALRGAAQTSHSRAMNPQVPVLFIAPKNDYPGLLKIKQMMFDALPRNPLTRMYEPNSSHIDAPSASRDEIVRWTAEVAGTSSPASGEARKWSARSTRRLRLRWRTS
jgi:hypothetical protein